MKKTTLYKLVKQALREVIRDSKDPKLVNKYVLKHENLTENEKLNLINESLVEQIEKERELSPFDNAKFSKEKIEKIYNFLVQNSEEEVPLDKIADDPLLNGINIDGLGAIYQKMSTITLEEFIELLPQMMFSSSMCPQGQNTIDPLTIYNSTCGIMQVIQPNFICCSGTSQNPNDNSGGGGGLGQILATLTSTAGPLNIKSDNDCYEVPYGTTSFDWSDFEDYAIGGGTNAGSGDGGLYGVGAMAFAAEWYDGNPGSVNFQGCVGCAHNGDIGTGTHPYFNGALGCPDANMNADPQNISCCSFSGCGAIGDGNPNNDPDQIMFPPADQSTWTVIPDYTTTILGNSVTISVISDEQQTYWTNDGSCQWSDQCTQDSITLGTNTYQTTNGPGYSPFTGVGCAGTYAAGGVASTQSDYCLENGGLGKTVGDDGSCEIIGCADASLQVVTDPFGTVLPTTYVGYPAGPVTSVTPNFTITNDQSMCQVTGCTDNSFGNYMPDTANYTVTPCNDTDNNGIPDCCGTGVDGCTVNTWSGYNSAANLMDNTCTHTGCVDPVGGTGSTDYICRVTPSLCLFDPNYAAGTPSTSTTACTCTAGAANCSECVPHGAPYADTNHPDALAVVGNVFTHSQNDCTGIVGCMDGNDNVSPNPGPTSNPAFDSSLPGAAANNNDWWQNTSTIAQSSATQNYSAAYPLVPVYHNSGINASNFNPLATVEDGSCLYIGVGWGCTQSQFCEYDINATYDDGSCSTLYGCMDSSPASSHTDAANAGTYVYQYADYDPANTFGCDETPTMCTECVYGCTIEEDANGVANQNYSNLNTCENGSCVPCVWGCMENNYSQYDPSATCDDFIDAVQSGTYCVNLCVYGCTDSTAFNYSAAATCDDGNCIAVVNGCTDSTAVNYDATANVDDGSCYFNPGCTDSTANNYDATADFDDGSCTYTSGCTDPTACNPSPGAVVDDGTCDYTSCLGCSDAAACNPSALLPGIVIDDGTCEYTSCAGCTDAAACNPTSGATIDNGTCEYTSCAGCMDATACNYDLTATISGTCTGTLYACIDESAATDPAAIASGFPYLYSNVTPGITTPDCDTNANQATNLCNPCVYGCPDLATNGFPNSNYNPLATCEVDCISCIFGCTCDGGAGTGAHPANDCYGDQIAAFNYDPLATCSANTICVQEVLGCTDQTACNYNALANTDDGTCDLNFGCTDPTACNYDSTASCQGTAICDPASTCTGCTNDWDNALISTYNSSNTSDDGSCEFNYCFVNPSTYGGGTITDYMCDSSATSPAGVPAYALCVDSSGVTLTQASIAGLDSSGGVVTYDNSILGTFNTGINQCTVEIKGCMDLGGTTQTWGTYGPYNSGVGVGINGQANNYNSSVNTACDSNCVNGPNGLMQTTDPTDPGITAGTHTLNDLGCCCSYTPGCTTAGDVNYNLSATQQEQDDCGGASVDGCTSPGFDNYNPLATNDDGSCEFDGCVDDGSGYNPNVGSPWDNYVCLLNSTNSTYAAVTAGPNDPTFNIACNGGTAPCTLEVGEWLCGCGVNNPIGGGVACAFDDDPLYSNGSFIDSINNFPTGGYDFYANPLTSADEGSCNFTSVEVLGCMDNNPYIQDDGLGNVITRPEAENYCGPGNLSGITPECNTPDNSCEYYGCEDETSNNFFCLLNPTLCITGGGLAFYGNSLITNTTGQTLQGILLPSTQAANPDFPTGYTCQRECKKVTYQSCSNPNQLTTYNGPWGIVRTISCLTIGGLAPALVTNDMFEADIIWEDQPLDEGFINEQAASINPGPGIATNYQPLVSPGGSSSPPSGPKCFKVLTVEDSIAGADFDYPSCDCDNKVTWDCCTFESCPGAYRYYYGAEWQAANPNMVPPSVNAFWEFCFPRFDGTGEFESEAECKPECGDKQDIQCQCCSAQGQAASIVYQPSQNQGGCGSLNGWNGYTHCQPAFDYQGNPTTPTIMDVCREQYPKKIKSSDPDKELDIDKVEPRDLEEPKIKAIEVPSGSALPKNLNPEIPIQTPDTPEVKESKKLRNLIKKWKRNNL